MLFPFIYEVQNKIDKGCCERDDSVSIYKWNGYKFRKIHNTGGEL